MMMEPFKSGQMHIHKYIYIHTYIHTYICKAVQTNELMKDFYQQKNDYAWLVLEILFLIF